MISKYAKIDLDVNDVQNHSYSTGNQGGMGFHDGEVASMSSSLANIDEYPAVNAE